MTKRFVLIGAAGYVAPKHFEAIAQNGGQLIAVLDPHDSVGVLDRYFPKCLYFREFERFDRYCSSKSIDYVSICSPNYLHDAHCRFALRIGASAICEKPLVLNSRNIAPLKKIEWQFNNKINVILQMRLHKNVDQLDCNNDKLNKALVWVRYITPRGPWYLQSWKGDPAKSGGLATNIGIHLIDLICSRYGSPLYLHVVSKSDVYIHFLMMCEYAKVYVKLSIADTYEPIRLFSVNTNSIDFTTGFGELHTQSYHEVLSGRGFRIDDILPATVICEHLRDAEVGAQFKFNKENTWADVKKTHQ